MISPCRDDLRAALDDEQDDRVRDGEEGVRDEGNCVCAGDGRL